MKLKDFVDTFICRNTLIRLWTVDGDYEVGEDDIPF